MTDQIITAGKHVSLTYSITDDSGNVLEQSDLPVGYIHGGCTELIGGMDQAIAGKCAGDKVSFGLPPTGAFGEHDPSLTFSDDIENVPPQFRRIGAEVQMQNETGEARTFYVTEIADGRLTVDGNHPLAGKTLQVSIQIQEVRAPTEQELMQETSGASCATPSTLH